MKGRIRIVGLSRNGDLITNRDFTIDLNNIPEEKRLGMFIESFSNWRKLINIGQEKDVIEDFIKFFNTTEDYTISLVEDEPVEVNMSSINMN